MLLQGHSIDGCLRLDLTWGLMRLLVYHILGLLGILMLLFLFWGGLRNDFLGCHGREMVSGVHLLLLLLLIVELLDHLVVLGVALVVLLLLLWRLLLLLIRSRLRRILQPWVLLRNLLLLMLWRLLSIGLTWLLRQGVWVSGRESVDFVELLFDLSALPIQLTAHIAISSNIAILQDITLHWDLSILILGPISVLHFSLSWVSLVLLQDD